MSVRPSGPKDQPGHHKAPEGGGRDSKTSLLEAAQAVMKDREARSAAEREARMHPKVRRRLSVMTLFGALGFLLVVLQPVWLAGPTKPPPETPAISAASLRLGMLRERQRILDFIRTKRRLPTTLAEVGTDLPGLGYEPGDNQTFRLFAQSGDSIVLLYSTDSMQAFLGNSLQVIKNRGKP